MPDTRLTIAAITGSRADWGLMRPVLDAIRQHPRLALELWVTGSHLEKRFANTVDVIREDGFSVDAEIPLNIQTDSAVATAQATANAMNGFAQQIEHSRPGLILILGDRYEIFAAAQAALFSRVPVAHIAGGDISMGAYDDAMRHAISKLSHRHFVTNAAAKQRLIHMGETPSQVILSGSPGIDAILATQRLSRKALEEQLGFVFRDRNLAVSLHPATLDTQSPDQQVRELLDGLGMLDESIGIVFTGSNADTGGAQINQALREFADQHDNCCFVQSLGSLRYFSLIEQVDLLVGNSSSGLYEAPSLGTRTLDIGIRQQGRLRGNSVTHCANLAQEICRSIENLLATDPPVRFETPYGDGHASDIIVKSLAAIEQPETLLMKSFHEAVPA